MDSAAILIDGGYLDKVKEDFGRPRLDYLRLSDELCKPLMRFRTYYYHCMPYQSNPSTLQERERFSRMDSFIQGYLKRLPRFEVRLGNLEMRADGPKQKGVDTRLAMDLVRLAVKGAVKKIILISGDADHTPAVEAAKEDMVIVKLYYQRGSVANKLLMVCDESEEITRELLYKFVSKNP